MHQCAGTPLWCAVWLSAWMPSLPLTSFPVYASLSPCLSLLLVFSIPMWSSVSNPFFFTPSPSLVLSFSCNLPSSQILPPTNLQALYKLLVHLSLLLYPCAPPSSPTTSCKQLLPFPYLPPSPLLLLHAFCTGFNLFPNTSHPPPPYLYKNFLHLPFPLPLHSTISSFTAHPATHTSHIKAGTLPSFLPQLPVWGYILYSGLRPPLGPVKVSWLEEWPHFRGEFALGSILWDILKWPEYRGGLISGVQIRGCIYSGLPLIRPPLGPVRVS